MTMRLLRRAALGLAIAAGGCGGASGKGADAPSADVRVPLEVYDFTLPNGMRVILDEDHSAPAVAVHVRYRVGSKDDPPGKSGMAHLVEHLMFQGTKSIEGTVHPWLTRAGATRVNATTNLDRTEYHEVVPAGALEWALWFEAERMAGLSERLDQAGFERERGVVKNELRERYENEDGGFLRSLRQAALFGKEHPYGRPTIGSLADLDSITLEEARAFHRRNYQPAGAILSLVGDFDRRVVAKHLERYFLPLPRVQVSPVRSAPLVVKGERFIDAEANVPRPRLNVSFVGPREGDPELPTLAAIAGHLASLMERWLVDERKLARRVRASVMPGLLASVVEFEVDMEKASSFDEVLRVVDKGLYDAKRAYFGNIAATLNHDKVERLFEYEAFDSRAGMYAEHDDLTQNPLYLARELEALNRAGRNDAFAAKAKWLEHSNRVVTRVHINEHAPQGGRLRLGGNG